MDTFVRQTPTPSVAFAGGLPPSVVTPPPSDDDDGDRAGGNQSKDDDPPLFTEEERLGPPCQGDRVMSPESGTPNNRGNGAYDHYGDLFNDP